MKKIVNILLVVALISILLVCTWQGFAAWMTDLLVTDLGNRNWHVVLPNNYEIVELSGQKIILVDNTPSVPNEIVVDSFVTAFCYNESFVAISAKASRDSLGDPVFYLIDTAQDISYGPYNQADFLACCNTCGVNDLGEWIPTVPAPDLASYHRE